MIKNILKIFIFTSFYLESSSFILNTNIVSNYNHKKYTSNYDNFYNICIMNEEYNISDTEYKENFLEDYHKNNTAYYSFDNKNKEKYHSITPSSKDLQLLNNMIAVEWSKTWIYNMIHYTDTFPTFMYQDMFMIRDFAIINSSKQYFYIGYFPSDIRCIHGPYYIGAFELIPKLREFHTHLLVQNPNYMIENEYDENKIIDFKRELIKMSQDSLVFFKFNKLKKGSNDRYYYSWLYGDE